MTTQNRDIAALIAVARMCANTAVTAGGAGDNTAVTGVIIDRAALGWPDSAVAAVTYSAALAATQTLSIGYTAQSGDNSGLSDAATLKTAALAVVATGPEGGGTVTGTFEVALSLRGAGRYVRVNFTPDLSRANTDTAALAGVLVVGGSKRAPI
jgi:hypothetical protein